MKVGKHLNEREIQEENTWVEAAKRDISKFSRLYDRYFESIFSYVFRRTEDEAISDDICSQTFLKAMQNITKYEFRGLPFSAWLFRIATNEVNKYYRENGKKSIFSIEEERLRILVDISEDLDEKESRINEMINVLKEAPTEIVEILELRFFEEKGFAEISYILNISESGAKMRTYRALEKLRRILENRSTGK